MVRCWCGFLKLFFISWCKDHIWSDSKVIREKKCLVHCAVHVTICGIRQAKYYTCKTCPFWPSVHCGRLSTVAILSHLATRPFQPLVLALCPFWPLVLALCPFWLFDHSCQPGHSSHPSTVIVCPFWLRSVSHISSTFAQVCWCRTVELKDDLGNWLGVGRK